MISTSDDLAVADAVLKETLSYPGISKLDLNLAQCRIGDEITNLLQAVAQSGVQVDKLFLFKCNITDANSSRMVAESGLAQPLLAEAGHLVEGADFRSTSTHAVSEPSG